MIAAAKASDGFLGDFRSLYMDDIFGPEASRRSAWIPAGEASCRVGQCFVLERTGERVRKIFIDKTTCTVIALALPRQGPDGQPTESITQVFDWGKDPGIETPPGDIVDATARDFENAFGDIFSAAYSADRAAESAPAAESVARPTGAQEPYPPPFAPVSEPFDMDRFLREIIDRPPDGVIFIIDSEGGGSTSPEIQMSTEIAVAFGDTPASSITLTVSGPGGDATIQLLDIGGESYMRTVIAGETSEWMKAAPGARTTDTLGVTGAIAYSIFQRDSFNPAEWFAAGQVRCRDHDCFVLRHRFDETRRLLIDSSTYAPVQTGWFEGLADNLTPINVTDIYDWGADLNLQKPAGNVPVASSAEILQACQDATQAALTSSE